jgi:hypothetical protein
MDQVHRWVCNGRIIVVVLAAFYKKDGEVGIGSSKTTGCYTGCSSSATHFMSVIEEDVFRLSTITYPAKTTSYSRPST